MVSDHLDRMTLSVISSLISRNPHFKFNNVDAELVRAENSAPSK